MLTNCRVQPVPDHDGLQEHVREELVGGAQLPQELNPGLHQGNQLHRRVVEPVPGLLTAAEAMNLYIYFHPIRAEGNTPAN